MIKTLFTESLALVALGLFLAMVLVWMSILDDNRCDILSYQPCSIVSSVR